MRRYWYHHIIAAAHRRDTERPRPPAQYSQETQTIRPPYTGRISGKRLPVSTYEVVLQIQTLDPYTYQRELPYHRVQVLR